MIIATWALPCCTIRSFIVLHLDTKTVRTWIGFYIINNVTLYKSSSFSLSQERMALDQSDLSKFSKLRPHKLRMEKKKIKIRYETKDGISFLGIVRSHLFVTHSYGYCKLYMTFSQLEKEKRKRDWEVRTHNVLFSCKILPSLISLSTIFKLAC